MPMPYKSSVFPAGSPKIPPHSGSTRAASALKPVDRSSSQSVERTAGATAESRTDPTGQFEAFHTSRVAFVDGTLVREVAICARHGERILASTWPESLTADLFMRITV